jgi:hypothetical protein
MAKSMKILTLSHTSPSGYHLTMPTATLPILVQNEQDILANSHKYDYLDGQFRWSTPRGLPAVKMRLLGGARLT